MSTNEIYNVNTIEPGTRKTQLHIVCELGLDSIALKMFDNMPFLFLNEQDAKGNTPFMILAALGKEELLLSMLKIVRTSLELEWMISFTIKNNDRKSLFELAVSKFGSDSCVVKELIDLGALESYRFC